jgi:hypothetical protein
MKIPYTTNTVQCIKNVNSAIAANNSKRVFDWDRAARLIMEQGGADADAGLGEDWGNTGGAIYRNHSPVDKKDTYTYLASLWATPVLFINGEYIECYLMEDKTPRWGQNTYWPASALKIVLGDT